MLLFVGVFSKHAKYDIICKWNWNKNVKFLPKIRRLCYYLEKSSSTRTGLLIFTKFDWGENFCSRTELFAASTISVVDGKIIIRWCNDYDIMIMVGQIRLYMKRVYSLKELMTTQILFEAKPIPENNTTYLLNFKRHLLSSDLNNHLFILLNSFKFLRTA